MGTKTGELQKKLDAFYASMKAQALLVALDWAGGSAKALSEAAGMKGNTANVWVRRKKIPPRAALILERVEGFPLTANEMCPDVEWSRFKRRWCPHCAKRIYPPFYRAGCLSASIRGGNGFRRAST